MTSPSRVGGEGVGSNEDTKGDPHTPPTSSPRAQFRVAVWGSETITSEMLEKCARLFTENYGHWGREGPRPGEAVRLSASRLLSQYLFNPETCSLITAEKRKCMGESGLEFELVGQAFVCTFPFLGGKAVWVTQLVIRRDMRRQGLATELLSKAWAKDAVAWGLMTSHPHAVKALERATERKCCPNKIALHASDLIKQSGIPYFQNCAFTVDEKQSIIHSRFFVDHEQVNKYLLELQGEWKLGVLEEGDEFFAFTFRD